VIYKDGLSLNCDHDHTGILAHTPAPHQAGPLPQSVKPLVTGTPSDAAAHESYPPRIKFLHQTVTERSQYETCSFHGDHVEDSGL